MTHAIPRVIEEIKERVIKKNGLRICSCYKCNFMANDRDKRQYEYRILDLKRVSITTSGSVY